MQWWSKALVTKAYLNSLLDPQQISFWGPSVGSWSGRIPSYLQLDSWVAGIHNQHHPRGPGGGVQSSPCPSLCGRGLHHHGSHGSPWYLLSAFVKKKSTGQIPTSRGERTCTTFPSICAQIQLTSHGEQTWWTHNLAFVMAWHRELGPPESWWSKASCVSPVKIAMPIRR